MALKLTVRTTGDSISAFHFVLDQPKVTLGRNTTSDVPLPFPTVSSHHLTLVHEGNTWLVADMGSTNGTALNGEALEADRYTPLRSGDVLVLTDVQIEIGIPDASETFTTAEQTAERVRSMVARYLRSNGPPDAARAWFDVLQGTDTGDRRVLSDTPSAVLPVGRAPGADGWKLRDATLTDVALTVTRTDDTYTLAALDDGPSVYLDGFALDPGHHVRLRGGGRVRVGNTTLLFVDPLERFLEELDALPDSHPTQPRSSTSEVPLTIASPAEGNTLPPGTAPSTTAAPAPRNTLPETPAAELRAAAELARSNDPRAAQRAIEDAIAGNPSAPAPAPGRSSTWTRMDMILISMALVLLIAAIGVLLLLFDVV